MIKNNDLLILSPLLVFNDDIYLTDERGNVFLKREAKNTEILNIFDLLPKEERLFIDKNKNFLDLRSALLVDSGIGPVFIDMLLYGCFNVFTVIVPHFSAEKIYALAKSDLQYCVKMSDRIKLKADMSDAFLEDEHHCFAKRLLGVHRGSFYYRIKSKTNAELAILMSEMAQAYSELCGCSLDFSINNLSEFDAKNMLCISSYQFTLTTVCLLARKYSAERIARIYVYFEEEGIYLECGFKIADDYRARFIGNDIPELVSLEQRAEMNFYHCQYYKNDSVFVLRAMPWYRCPSSLELKQKEPKLIYN